MPLLVSTSMTMVALSAAAPILHALSRKQTCLTPRPSTCSELREWEGLRTPQPTRGLMAFAQRPVPLFSAGDHVVRRPPLKEARLQYFGYSFVYMNR